MILLVLFHYGKQLIVFYFNIYCVDAGISISKSVSDGLGSDFFCSTDGKDEAYDGRNGWKYVCFRPEWAFFVFVVNIKKVIFPICTLTWRLNNYVSRRGKGIYSRNESTVIIFSIIVKDCTSLND